MKLVSCLLGSKPVFKHQLSTTQLLRSRRIAAHGIFFGGGEVWRAFTRPFQRRAGADCHLTRRGAVAWFLVGFSPV